MYAECFKDKSVTLPFQQASVNGVSSLLPEGVFTSAPRPSNNLVVARWPSLKWAKYEITTRLIDIFLIFQH